MRARVDIISISLLRKTICLEVPVLVVGQHQDVQRSHHQLEDGFCHWRRSLALVLLDRVGDSSIAQDPQGSEETLLNQLNPYRWQSLTQSFEMLGIRKYFKESEKRVDIFRFAFREVEKSETGLEKFRKKVGPRGGHLGIG